MPDHLHSLCSSPLFPQAGHPLLRLCLVATSSPLPYHRRCSHDPRPHPRSPAAPRTTSSLVSRRTPGCWQPRAQRSTIRRSATSPLRAGRTPGWEVRSSLGTPTRCSATAASAGAQSRTSGSASSTPRRASCGTTRCPTRSTTRPTSRSSTPSRARVANLPSASTTTARRRGSLRR